MAALLEEAMESYTYQLPYSSNPYPRYPQPSSSSSSSSKGKGGSSWRQPRSSGYFPSYGPSAAAATAAAAAAAAEYLESYQRAQLKALLAQVNPALTPRLRRANTKEVGVQVNPRRDAAVQCSLGARTLVLPRRRGLGPGQQEPKGGWQQGFPRRSLALYSPVASRRLTAFLQEEKKEKEKEPPKEEGATGEGASTEGESGREAPKEGEKEEEEKEKEGEKQEEEKEGKEEEEEESQGPAQSKTRVRFQFLEQKYGYYHCKDCNIRWESAYVWCVQGTNKVYFRQFCRTCQKSYNPYRVEDITCQSCKQTRCTCPVKLRHVDPKRPHRQDLCGRCKGKRLSCDSTFSFKYII